MVGPVHLSLADPESLAINGTVCGGDVVPMPWEPAVDGRERA